MSSPFDALGLPATASAEQVRKRYLELAKVHHPDAGGSPEAFNRLREAYEAALENVGVAKREDDGPCATCGGTRKMTKTFGFQTVELACPACLQRGEVP